MLYALLVQVVRDWLNEKRFNAIFNTHGLEEQKNHLDDCYFCLVNITGFSVKNKHTIVYPDLESTWRPIPHKTSLPVPIPMPQQINYVSDLVEGVQSVMEEIHENSTDPEYIPKMM